MRLNIGCGRVHRQGAVNLDISPDVGADVVHDLNCLPWPFEAGQFEQFAHTRAGPFGRGEDLRQ